jgi:alpha-mannosidase
MDHRIVRNKIAILQSLAVAESLPLGPWEGRAAWHLAPGEYEWLDDWRSVAETTWWPALQTAFLRARLTVPADWQGRADLSFSCTDLEGQVFLSGRPWAGLDTYGHQRCPAPPPGEHDLLLEFHAVQPAFSQPELRGRHGVFRGGALLLLDPEIQALVYDYRFALETCEAIPDERRRLRLEAALEAAVLIPDLTAPREELLAQIHESRDLLAARVAEIAPDPEGGRLFLTGHSHIDTAWLWPIKETIRKCGRTFSTACRLMERYPEYRFSCSQPQLYAYVKQHYPALYEEIKAQVAAGRWETTGAMWVEADTNISSGEALLRQMLYGLQFFAREFGTRPTLCWLPDVFGYNAGLPQLLAGCGLRSFWTWKLYWQSRNDFPHHLFWWEGVDGTRVLAHIPKLGGGGYNGTPNPQQLSQAWAANRQKAGYEQQLFPFGYGDGGGGATEEMLEYLRRAAHYPGLPACRQGLAEEFFAEAHEQAGDLPVWVGELYLETHRGTYTTQAETKRGNRKCELALRDLEIWGTLAGAPDRLLGLTGDLWRKVLLYQFHDILPGSSIGEVYEETARDHAKVLSTATQARDLALSALSAAGEGAFRLYNSLSWERSDVVTLPVEGAQEPLVALCGDRRLPTQPTAAGVLVVAEGVPAVGACTVTLEPGESPATAVRAEGNALENEFYRLELAEDGAIQRLYDKRCDREVLDTGQRGNLLQLFQDGPSPESAWNIEATYEQREYTWEGETTVELAESGPVRARARVTRRHRETVLTQDICLYHGLPRIDFVTRVDWRERQTVLKAGFPLAVRAAHATYEVQFGAYERPTHRNTSWDEEKFEVCAQRWADLSEAGYGVSLLTDCKYGYDCLDTGCHGSNLRLTLLRGTEYPDPHADLGVHEFTYSLLPHAGDWRQGEAVRQAYALNVPLLSRLAAPGAPAVSYVTVDGPAILEALKPAEDGDGVILRLYEPHGGRGQVLVTHQLPGAGVVACNLVEEGEAPVESAPGRFQFQIKPFEVRTFRLR